MDYVVNRCIKLFLEHTYGALMKEGKKDEAYAGQCLVRYFRLAQKDALLEREELAELLDNKLDQLKALNKSVY
jgi:hypothetical protein